VYSVGGPWVNWQMLVGAAFVGALGGHEGHPYGTPMGQRIGRVQAQLRPFQRRLAVSMGHVNVVGERGRGPRGFPACSSYFVSVPKWK